MGSEEPSSEGFAERLPEDMPGKIDRFCRLLEERDIPYAIGGAIALGYYRRARGTTDIDIDIFLPPEEHPRVLDVLEEVFPIPDREALAQEIQKNDQGHTFWGGTRIDVFFADTEFHRSMGRRVRRVPSIDGDSEMSILSAEDLLVCKTLFNRTEDWVDIQKVCEYMGPKLDAAYLERWLKYFLPPDDPTITRLLGLVEEHSA